MRVIATLTATAWLLAGCSQPDTESTPEVASEPASAPASVAKVGAHTLNNVDLNQPLSLIGTEPFWSITTSSSAVTLKRPDENDVRFPAIPFLIAGDRAELSDTDLKLTLTAVTCSDGMSDRAYPLTAEVVYKGKSLQGCAVPTADLDMNRP